MTSYHHRSLVLYHRNCADGLMAAALLAMYGQTFQDTGFVAVDYETTDEFIARLDVSPEVRNLVLVDFSFKDHHLEHLSKRRWPSLHITMYDHHKGSVEQDGVILTNHSRSDLSGCQIVAHRLGDVVPKHVVDVVNLVGLRDRWQPVEPGAVDHFKVHSETFDRIVRHAPQTLDAVSYERLAAIGKIMIDEYSSYQEGDTRVTDVKQALIESHIVTQGRMVTYHNPRNPGETCRVVVVAGLRSLDSAIGDTIRKRMLCDFACMTRTLINREATSEIECSLRSPSTGREVASIAKRLGGGGHDNAAGFRTRVNPIEAIRVVLASEWLVLPTEIEYEIDVVPDLT